MAASKPRYRQPDGVIVSTAERIVGRAAELEADGATPHRALVMALLEVSPTILAEIDRLDDAADRNRAATENKPAVIAATDGVMRLLDAARVPDAKFLRRTDWDDNGRDGILIGFQVILGSKRTPVLMPGTPVELWNHERCYIDGNSWMWKFAPDVLRTTLGLRRMAAGY